MKRPCAFGILAHVDAGKTTLSERILHACGVVRALGRVDYGTAALDADEIERERGITVFSDQAAFELEGRRMTLIDTPGHADFGGETERAMLAMDLAILVVDGASGIQAHTASLFSLAARYRLPVLLFINKTDLPSCDLQSTLRQAKRRLSPALVALTDGAPDMEALSMIDDAFCEAYLNATATRETAWETLARCFHRREAFPVLSGAALSGTGVKELLETLARLSDFQAPDCSGLDGVVYKVRRDPSGERVTFVRLFSGSLRPRDALRVGDGVEKVHQLRLYRGAAFSPLEQAGPGDAVGVTGWSTPRCGDMLRDGVWTAPARAFATAPVLSARVEAAQGATPHALLSAMRTLEEEEPTLSVGWEPQNATVTARVMGTVQTEVLSQLLRRRFGIEARFREPLVLYRETVAAPVVGCGHYEPLRHYAEVHLRLSPGERGSGVVFESRCHVNDLPLHYQRLIGTHVLEREHRGVLTGAPLTDVRVELLSGRAHLKHTEGGDFRQAVYRAIRQALFKAQSVLLEPYYAFVLTVPTDCLGRVMTDLTSMCACYDPPEPMEDDVRLTGRGPVQTMMAYPPALRALTRGRGDIQLVADGYEPCHNAEAVIAETAYNALADTDQTPHSVFCSHGAGYLVPWQEADEHMHLPVEAAQ